MTGKVHIEVRPEYGCHPVWMDTGRGSRENTDPAALRVEATLARDLAAWAADFDATLNREYPPDSGFADPNAEDGFWARGMLLACRLAIGLAGRYSVAYWDGRLSCLVLLSATGGVPVDRGRLRLPDHWVDLANESTLRQRLTEQLHRELPAGHVLDGKDVYLIARCTRCDDVLLGLGNYGYGIVHLTWRNGHEISTDWPSTQLHSDPASLLADLADRHDEVDL